MTPVPGGQVSLRQSPLPPDAAQRLKQEIRPGETVLWVAQPARRHLLRRHSPLLTAGVVVCLSGLLMEEVSATQHSPFGMVAAGILALLGLWTALQGVRGAWKAMQSVYAVTPARAIILGGDGAAVSLSPEQARARTLRAGRGGNGDLFFACLERTVTIEDSEKVERGGFLSIADVPAVDRLLRQTFREETPHDD